jgi:molybdenum cofactor biosynthesis enzyme MoaA
MRNIRKLRYTITRDCPFNCYYCHNEGMGKKTLADRKERLDSQSFLFFCKILKENFGLSQVTLTGGDPFVAPNILEVGEGLKNIGLFSRVISRGAPIYRLYNKEKLKELPFDSFIFSIDTLRKDLFKKITRTPSSYLEDNIKALKLVKNLGSRVEINCTVTPESPTEDIEDIIQLAKDMEISELRLYEVINPEEIKKPYIEKVLHSIGLVDSPEQEKPLPFRKVLYDKETKIILRRCACNMVVFERDHSYCKNSPSLVMDSQGRVNSCLFLDVHSNPESLKIYQPISKRKEKEILNILKSYEPLTICPLLEKKKSLKLGSYH